MRVAALSDIHGNLAALETVLADLEKSGWPDKIIILGDLAMLGPWPGEVIERLQTLDCKALQGNTDTWYGEEIPKDYTAQSPREAKMVATYHWAKAYLTPSQIEYLLQLPFSHEVQPLPEGEGNALFVHGSPRRIDEPILAETPEEEIRTMLEGTKFSLLVCGHTHRPMVRRIGEVTIVNVGSVGLPYDGNPDAAYGILTWQGREWQTELRRVPYDIEGAAAAAIGRQMPGTEGYVRSIRTGRAPT
jgi:predicted phosphodiesterase